MAKRFIFPMVMLALLGCFTANCVDTSAHDNQDRAFGGQASLLAALHVPQAVVSNYVNREFKQYFPVDRTVLGTHSTGSGVCHGRISCELMENHSQAVFRITILGVVDSVACGRNGPAIIQTQSHSNYHAVKYLVFDGRSFVQSPVELGVDTNIEITGIGSSAPRVRGRIVRRVANRKAQESLSKAEAIVRGIVCSELKRQIEVEFKNEVNLLNGRLAQHRVWLEALENLGQVLAIRSRSSGLEITLYSSTLNVDYRNTPVGLGRGDGIELWLPMPRSPVVDPETRRWLSLWSEWVPDILSKYSVHSLASSALIPLDSVIHTLQEVDQAWDKVNGMFDLQREDEWLVVELERLPF